MNTAPKRPLVDEQSFALAQHFLRDSDIDAQAFTGKVWQLAGAIQSTIEDWLEENGIR